MMQYYHKLMFLYYNNVKMQAFIIPFFLLLQLPLTTDLD